MSNIAGNERKTRTRVICIIHARKSIRLQFNLFMNNLNTMRMSDVLWNWQVPGNGNNRIFRTTAAGVGKFHENEHFYSICRDRTKHIPRETAAFFRAALFPARRALPNSDVLSRAKRRKKDFQDPSRVLSSSGIDCRRKETLNKYKRFSSRGCKS